MTVVTLILMTLVTIALMTLALATLFLVTLALVTLVLMTLVTLALLTLVTLSLPYDPCDHSPYDPGSGEAAGEVPALSEREVSRQQLLLQAGGRIRLGCVRQTPCAIGCGGGEDRRGAVFRVGPWAEEAINAAICAWRKDLDSALVEFIV